MVAIERVFGPCPRRSGVTEMNSKPLRCDARIEQLVKQLKGSIRPRTDDKRIELADVGPQRREDRIEPLYRCESGHDSDRLAPIEAITQQSCDLLLRAVEKDLSCNRHC